MANIIVLGTKVPFSSGGAESLVSSLVAELKKRGHQTDTVSLPFNIPEKGALLNQIALWRSLDLSSFSGSTVDLVIATKFPTYFARHPKKSLWLVHQLREAYDLHGTSFSNFTDDPRDEELRRIIVKNDEKAFSECAVKTGISQTVVDRLKKYHSIDATPLFPPLPLGNRYISNPVPPSGAPYILSVGRLLHIKRVDMMIKALPLIHSSVTLKIVGSPDSPGIMEYYKSEIDKHHLWDRVQFCGRVSDEELLSLYKDASLVYYAPYNEDYGYVTLEAFASGKLVITAKDSGGVLEFVEDQVNGRICDPNSDSIAHAINALLADKSTIEKFGTAARKKVEDLKILEAGWDTVVNTLLSPIAGVVS